MRRVHTHLVRRLARCCALAATPTCGESIRLLLLGRDERAPGAVLASLSSGWGPSVLAAAC